MAQRVLLNDFSLENPIYSTATVTVFTVDPATLLITETLATVYDAPTGPGLLSNPQDLDGNGKWVVPPYVDVAVILQISSGAFETQTTGITGVVDPVVLNDLITRLEAGVTAHATDLIAVTQDSTGPDTGSTVTFNMSDYLDGGFAGGFSTLGLTDITEFSQAQFAEPSVGTRSRGTRVVFYPSLDASNADYAVGVGVGGELWHSVNTGAVHAWYVNATKAAKIGLLNGAGVLTIPVVTGDGSQNLGAGANFNPFLSFTGAMSGVKAGGSPALALFQTSSDTMASGGGGLIGMKVDMNAGGVGTTGNRVGIYSNLNFTGGATNKGLGIGSNYSPAFFYGTVSGNVGGTSGAGNTWGSLWGGIASAHLAAGATFWSEAIGFEIDVGVSAGASAAYIQGLKIVAALNDQTPIATDYGLGLAALSPTTKPFYNGLSFGSPDGYWPIDPAGTLITTQIVSNPRLPAGPANLAAFGFDGSGCTFSTAFLKSIGYLVDGSGNETAASYRVGASGPTVTAGAPAPSGTQPKGSLYLRTAGANGSTLYLSQGAGAWAPVGPAYTVDDYGAAGDGTTDDTAAFTAYVAALRASIIAGTPQRAYELGNGRVYRVSASLDMTGFNGITFDGHGSKIISSATGVALVDWIGCTQCTMRDMVIQGGSSGTPALVGIQIGRINNTQGRAENVFSDIQVDGYFTQAAMHNNGSEVLSATGLHLIQRYASATAYALIQDGTNHWPVTSSFQTITLTPDTFASFNGNIFIRPVFYNLGTGPVVAMSGASGHQFIGGYTLQSSTTLPAVDLFFLSGAGGRQIGLNWDCHCEVAPSSIFRLNGLATVELSGLRYRDNVMQAATVFALGATTTAVNIENAEIDLLQVISSTCRMFDTPAAYSMSGEVYIPSADAAVWNAPLHFTGRLRTDTTRGSFTMGAGSALTEDFTASTFATSQVTASGYVSAGAGTASIGTETTNGTLNLGIPGTASKGTIQFYGNGHSGSASAEIQNDADGQISILRPAGGNAALALLGTLAATAGASVGTGLANHVNLAGAATGNGVSMSAAGSDTDVDLRLIPQGAGATTFVGLIAAPTLRSSTSYANDAAAATGGVGLGQFYRSGSAVQCRVA